MPPDGVSEFHTNIRVLGTIGDVVEATAVLDALAAPRLVEDVLGVVLRIVRPVSVFSLCPLVVYNCGGYCETSLLKV